ncbi:MAG: TolC family protein, partial [Candidatus Omnitrophica bacterium]|nr:TolC family protein [Candidatus Omnitrophota bacterium]
MKTPRIRIDVYQLLALLLLLSPICCWSQEGLAPAAPSQNQLAANDLPLEEEAPIETSQGAAGSVSSLDSLLNMAIRQSPKLSVQRNKVNESQMRVMAAGLLPNPSIEVGRKKVSGGDSGPLLSVSQELPLNGALGFERQAAGWEYNAQQAALSREIQLVLAEVQLAFIHVLAAGNLLAIEQEGVAIAGQSLKLVSDTLKAGLVSTLPYNLASLAALLGIPLSGLDPVQGDLRASLLPAGWNGSQVRRSDLQAADYRLRATQAQVAAADRARLPNPVIGYSREEADETENFFSIGLEIPVFNTGRAAVQEKQAVSGTAYAERQALSKEVQSEMAQAQTRLEARRDAVRIYETEIEP